ncbi:MAG: GTP 3',8-cyclase MoaA [Syntrophomonadaceae bacterium]|nr:GTP 3',8-cyclase MoaA [Syntrophomonadaceae bacterium]
MIDGFGRNINYLRVSVTDRCNLRCRYCMPEDGVSHIQHTDVLRLEELALLIRVAASIGIKKVRITGGEPLVRKNVTKLVRDVGAIKSIDDVALTTNGILFQELAEQLKDAGLKRVNFSLDTLRDDRFRYITRSEASVSAVRKAIDLALKLGLNPVKLNVVVIRGFNDDELLDFAHLAWAYPLHVRFIEFMPVGDLLFWERQRLVSMAEMKELLEQRYEMIPGKRVYGNGPARYYSLVGGEGSIGFINPISNHFCGECNRLRLTCGGMLRACLYDSHESDLKAALRSGADEDALRQIFIDTINAKPEKHKMETGWGSENRRRMYQIGG